MYRRVVFVRNLPRNTTAADCQALFAPYGRVLKLWLGTRPDVAGSAYAALPSREQALDAVNGLTGRPMQVSPRCARAARSAQRAARTGACKRLARRAVLARRRERRTPHAAPTPRAGRSARGAGRRREMVLVSPPARRAAYAWVRV